VSVHLRTANQHGFKSGKKGSLAPEGTSDNEKVLQTARSVTSAFFGSQFVIAKQTLLKKYFNQNLPIL
jgi:hypothetical protein